MTSVGQLDDRDEQGPLRIENLVASRLEQFDRIPIRIFNLSCSASKSSVRSLLSCRRPRQMAQLVGIPYDV